MREDYDSILLTATQLAHEAGRVQLSYFRKAHLAMATKSNSFDIVTAADKASEQVVKQGIARAFPTHAILSEESGLDQQNRDSDWEWVIDPVDGTTNFNAGLPFFNVSIGVRHCRRTVVGVVFAPALGELFTAVVGQGAQLNGRPIHCSACQELATAVVSTGFPYDKAETADNNLDAVSRVMPRVRGLRRLGSAALDMSYVAAGFLDGYWELNLHEWDVCAASLIAAEAGAVVERYRPDRGISIMAAAPVLAPKLQALL